MVAPADVVVVCVLCAHLRCFAAMFWPIGTRLQGGKLGREVFAVGNALLGLAYVLQLRVPARLADGASYRARPRCCAVR